VSAVVDAGPASINTTRYSTNNYLYVTVHVCQPGTTTCVDVDHVQVSTATSGLRLLQTAVTGLTLTPEPDPAAAGNSLAECYQLPQGTAFGNVVTADLTIGGETAANVPVQIIANPSATPSASTCADNGFIAGDQPAGVDTLGANGVLGLGPLAQDCSSSSCVNQYFTCVTNPHTGVANCQTNVSAAPPATAQVTNPVTMFATDKNGVIITLPTVDPNVGAASGLAGTITFGIGTESNNAYGTTATALAADPSTGAVTTTYTAQASGSTATQYKSWIDTGSYAYFFPDAGIPLCTAAGLTSFYCPPQPLNLQASVAGANSTGPATVNFTVVSAQTLFAGTNIALSSLAANAPPNPDYLANGSSAFIWGLPFFYGRTVYIAYPGATVSGSGGTPLSGPFYAF
jgi:hypothetical protein